MGELSGKFFAEARGRTGDQQAGNVFHREEKWLVFGLRGFFGDVFFPHRIDRRAADGFDGVGLIRAIVAGGVELADQILAGRFFLIDPVKKGAGDAIALFVGTAFWIELP